MGEKAAKITAAEQMEWRKKMYKLWHEWLQLSNEDDWSDSFRDKYREASAVSFEVWWDKNSILTSGLKSLEEYAFTPIETVEEFEESNCFPYDKYDLDERIYRISFSVPKHVLRKRLEQLINEFHTNNNTGQRFEDLSDIGMNVVELVKHPTKRFVETVETILKVYKARRDFPEKKLYEIGSHVGLKTAKGGLFDDKKQLMSLTVSRYLKWGDEIAKHLPIGVFPRYNMRN